MAHTALTHSTLIWDNKQTHSSSPNSEIWCYINNASSYLEAVRLKYSLTWAVQRLYGHFNLLSEAATDWKCRVLKAAWGEMLAEILRHFFSFSFVLSSTVWSIVHPALASPWGGLVKRGLFMILPLLSNWTWSFVWGLLGVTQQDTKMHLNRSCIV